MTRVLALGVSMLLALIGGSDSLAAGGAGSATAGEGTARLTLPMAAKLVRSASAGQFSAVQLFNGPHHLLGVVVAQTGDPASSTSVMWITPDGTGLVSGTLVDATGTDLNQAALVRLGLRYDASESLQRASAPAVRPMVMGTGGPILTVFIDPNCSYCHLLYQEIMPYVLDKDLRLRFVMVGVIKPDSKDRAAAILSAQNPLAALQQDQDRFDIGSEEGGYPILATNRSMAAVTAIAGNDALMTKTGIDGTPAFLFCSKAKSAVQLLIGMPQDLKQFLADVGAGPASACAG